MPFVKGQSGNPKGRPHRGETLRDVLKQRLNKRKKSAIIDKLIMFALAGDMKAMALVLDNHDGKLPTRTMIGGDPDNREPVPLIIERPAPDA